MARRAIWRLLAEEDLTEAYLYIGQESPAAAERLLDAAAATVESLLAHPGTGRPRQFRSPRAQGLRSRPIRGFTSYLIFYRASGNDLEIVRLIHGARDIPGILEDDD